MCKIGLIIFPSNPFFNFPLKYLTFPAGNNEFYVISSHCFETPVVCAPIETYVFIPLLHLLHDSELELYMCELREGREFVSLFSATPAL